MAIDDDAAEAQARGWRRLAALQTRIENRIGAALEADHDPVSYTHLTLPTTSRV